MWVCLWEARYLSLSWEVKNPAEKIRSGIKFDIEESLKRWKVVGSVRCVPWQRLQTMGMRGVCLGELSCSSIHYCLKASVDIYIDGPSPPSSFTSHWTKGLQCIENIFWQDCPVTSWMSLLEAFFLVSSISIFQDVEEVDVYLVSS
jgi:hypothetical protein